MIQPTEEAGGGKNKLPFTLVTGELPEAKFIVKPNSNYIWLRYEQPKIKGGIHIPGSAKGLDWISGVVIAKGPDCKFVKKDDRVVLATKGMVGGESGMVVDGFRFHMTQENMVVGVLKVGAE